MTLTDLRKITVDRFEDVAVRKDLFTKLQRFVDTLIDKQIPCDLWIDGSFVTEAVDPDDIDIAVKVMDDVMQRLTPDQSRFLDAVSRDDCAYIEGLDTHVFAGYWIGHERYGTDADDGHSMTTPSWATQFGKGRDHWLKGIVVIPVMETNLGLFVRT